MRLVDSIRHIMPQLLGASALDVPLRQRAKFENWFKIELAAALEEAGYPVRLEESFQSQAGRTYRADIAATVEGTTCLVMLKTVNTNFRFPGVESLTRPITQNITEVIQDIEKLEGRPPGPVGFVLFPIFPVASHELDRNEQLRRHLDRIRNTGVGFVATGFLSRHPDWGLSWYLCQVERHG